MISCVYCGGAHARPTDVKRCWSEHDAPSPPLEGGGGGQPGPGLPAPATVGLLPVDMAARPGPAALGRNVVVAPGALPPEPWSAAERICVDAEAQLAPSAAVAALRAAALAGRPCTIEVASAFDDPPQPVEERAPHEVGVGHAFEIEELHHLVWANSIDVRDAATPRWGLLERAVALGATPVTDDGAGDVALPDGRRAWLDGGPLRHHDPIDGVEVLHSVQVEHGRLATALANVTAADLAPDQLAAVTHAGGAARIIAPAGSGKTRVLTERARHLLRVWQLPPGAVTLVAFNKRAQEEMSDRTADLDGLQVRTLNSIALAIIDGAVPFAPQPRRWRTIGEPDVRRILQRFVNVPRRRNTDALAPWIDALGLVRLGLLDPAEVEARSGGDVQGLGEIYPQYLAALEQEGVVDFDGQIQRAIEVMLTQPAARAAAQRASRVLLVDEFQDLTPAHLLLVRLLASPGGSVFGVGDDDQTIYGFNGADPGWLIDFDHWFPGAGAHPLEVNYRCPAGVVEIADRLLRHNRRRVPKLIRAASSDTGGWSAVAGDDPVGETVAAVRGAIATGARPAEVAVLTRVNASIAPVQVALAESGVPVSGGVGTEFLNRAAVRPALSWLRLATAGRFNADDIGEALRRPSRPLHPRIGEWVAEQGDVEALLRLADRLNNERDAERVTEFVRDIERLRSMAAAGASTSHLLAVLVDEIGLGGAVATLDGTRRGMNRSAQGDDLQALRHLAGLHDDPATFHRWLADLLAVPREPTGVTLATVHRVKGQEWPHVVVHLADADQFPHRLADDPEEERRLFHVAITRTASQLTIVSGDSPSPFVAELTTEPSATDLALERHRTPPPGSARNQPGGRGRRDTPAEHPLLDRSLVMAAAGLVLVDQGQEWTIVELEPEAVVAERNGVTRRFRLGDAVQTAGQQRGALGQLTGDVDEASARLFDLLRSYRNQSRGGKPAYTVFDDKTLVAIASALPADLDELAAVKGIGPAKLEQYGDDVLALVVDALEPSP